MKHDQVLYFSILKTLSKECWKFSLKIPFIRLWFHKIFHSFLRITFEVSYIFLR